MSRTVGAIFLLQTVWFVSFGQCVLDTQLLTPLADKALNENYGFSMDSFEDHLVVAAAGNDSTGADVGMVYVYKLNATGEWQRIAKLWPSYSQHSMEFGQEVSIYGNTIAVFGRWTDTQGYSFYKVFIFEKDPVGGWESGTESYQIDLATGSNHALALDLHANFLAVSYGTNTNIQVDIYKRDLNVLVLQQQITAPLDAAGSSGEFGRHLAISEEVLVVSGAGFQTTMNHSNNGAVFLFINNGGVWDPAPTTMLRPSDASSFYNFYFGINVWLENDLIVVLAQRTNQRFIDEGYNLYFFNKPAGGWTDMQENAQVGLGTNYVNQFSIAITDDYVFAPKADWSAVDIYKRNSPTSISKTSQALLPESKSPTFRPFNHHKIATNGNHLMVALTLNLFDHETSNMVFDFQPDGDWQNGGHLNQELRESSLNATNDKFGTDIASADDVLVVGAPWDETKGINGGAAYVYAYQNKKWELKTMLTAPNGSVGDQFGSAVAIGDSTIFVGATYGDTYRNEAQPFGDNAGIVYVYKQTSAGWQYQSVITAPQIKQPGGFGMEIVYHNGYVVISEFVTSDSERRGLAHIYKKNRTGEWKFIATLRPSDDMRGDFFGRTMAMNDSTIIIGTGNVGYNASYAMKVYVYQKKGEWKNAFEDARLLPAIPMRNNFFGFSVDLYGDEIVVGSPGYGNFVHSSNEFWNGAAYIFKRPTGGWYGTINELAMLQPSNPSKHNSFGYSVAMDEGEIYVGAPHTLQVYNVADNVNNSDNHIKPGTVYHYLKKGAWLSTNQEDKKLPSLDPEWGDGFGAKLLIKNCFLFVGAPLDDTETGFRTGGVHSFMLAPKIAAVETPCVEDGPVKLKAYPSGGTWTISGRPEQVSGEFVLQPGDYTASYKVNGCFVDTSFRVISSGLNVFSHNAGEHLKCIYQQVSLSLESNASLSNYSWHFRAHESDTVSQQIQVDTDNIKVTDSGFYIVKINHERCNAYTQHFEVVNEAPAEIDIEDPPVICSEDAIQLIASPVGGRWAGNVALNEQGIFDPDNVVDGTYTGGYTVTTPLGCTFNKDVTIRVDKLVKPEIVSSGNLLCLERPVVLQLNAPVNNSTIQWLKADDNAVKGADVKFEVKEPGVYWAEVFKHDCSTRSEAVEIKYQPDSLFVPNVFTPNGDLRNDYFEVHGIGLNDFDLQVVNRYGQPVYRTQQPEFKWSGDDVIGGIYYWYIRYRTCIRDTKEFKGLVEVVK